MILTKSWQCRCRCCGVWFATARKDAKYCRWRCKHEGRRVRDGLRPMNHGGEFKPEFVEEARPYVERIR